MEIRKSSVLLACLCLVFVLPAAADYLEVTRSATIKENPVGDAVILARPEIGTLLQLLAAGEQTNGYYQVPVPGTGQPGWIYRTLVRRHAGELPGPAPPTGTDGEGGFAGRHLRLGRPIVLHEDAREGYAFGYDSRLKIPIWVQYELTAAELSGPGDRNGSRWQPEPSLPVGFRSELADYRNSGFDRGHMAPAGDMVRSQQVMDESHILSNAAPQVGRGFNQRIWRNLETAIRGWVNQRGTLTIITGPVFAVQNGRVDYQVIGERGVAVATHFYKIVVDTSDPNAPEALAFLMPNEDLGARQVGEFLVSIDAVELATGIDFLSALPKDIEGELETATPTQVWQ